MTNEVATVRQSWPRTSTPLGNLLQGVNALVTRRTDSARDASRGAPPAATFGILMYHRVTERVAGVDEPTWNVTPGQLRRQLAGLLSRGFEAWPLRKLIEVRCASGPIPPNVFAVTFDDGYENNHAQAWPILRELNVPATIFLATEFLDTPGPFPFDDWSEGGSSRVGSTSWRPLSSEQCSQMLAGGLIELGTHTHSHQDFVGRVDEFRRDLFASIEVLRARFNLRRPTFAFPFGRTSLELIHAAKEAGVACALSTRHRRIGAGADPFRWGRFGVLETDTAAALAAVLAGRHALAGWARRASKRLMAVVAPSARGRRGGRPPLAAPVEASRSRRSLAKP